MWKELWKFVFRVGKQNYGNSFSICRSESIFHKKMQKMALPQQNKIKSEKYLGVK